MKTRWPALSPRAPRTAADYVRTHVPSSPSHRHAADSLHTLADVHAAATALTAAPIRSP
ncbi:hypothetical protein OHR68_12970 [Spirillospora sp. NBC_00431]